MAEQDTVGTPEGLNAFIASRGPQTGGNGTVTSAAPLVIEPEAGATAAAVAEPVAEPSAWDDPETHDRIERPTRADKRIKRLWAEKQQEKDRADRLERELAVARNATAVPADAAPAPATIPAATDTAAPDQELTAAAQTRIRPKPDRAAIGTTYATYEDYVEDCAIWGGELAAEKRAILGELNQAQTAEQQRQQTFAKTFADQKATITGYDEAIASAATLQTSPWIDEAVKDTPQFGAHLIYWIATHAEDVNRIRALSPAAQMLEMGKVIATVEAAQSGNGHAKPPTRHPTSTAPAPIAPATRAAVQSARLEDAKTYNEFETKRNADLQAKRRVR